MIFLFGLVVWDFWIIQSVINSRKFLSDPVPIDSPQAYTQFSIPSSFQFCFPIPILWAPCYIEITLAARGLRNPREFSNDGSRGTVTKQCCRGRCHLGCTGRPWRRNQVIHWLHWALLHGEWKNISMIYNLSFCVYRWSKISHKGSEVWI